MDYARRYQRIVHQQLVEPLPVHRAVSIPAAQPFPPEVFHHVEDLSEARRVI